MVIILVILNLVIGIMLNHIIHKYIIIFFFLVHWNTFFETFELAVLDPQSRIIKSAEEQIPIPPNIISSISF